MGEKLVTLIAALFSTSAAGFLIIAIIELIRYALSVSAFAYDLSSLSEEELRLFRLEHTPLKVFKYTWISAALFIFPFYLWSGPKSLAFFTFFFVITLSLWLYEKKRLKKIKAEVDRDQKPSSDS